MKAYSSFLKYFSSMSLAVSLKVSSSELKKSCSVDGKCPNFSVQLYL